MKSKIIDFFDYNTLEIPTELKKWHIPEEEIQNELEALAADNASQAEVTDAIAVGDSVRCVCTACGEKAWIGRTVLLYPGRCLPGAEEAEKRIVGCKVGQEITCTVGQWEMTVTIEGAVRQITSAVNDAFVVSLNIPGVSTVAEYSRWYHQQHDMERKTKASYGITHFWLTQTAERSTYEIDEEEKWQWCLERGKIMFEGMLAAGVDMRIPEEGFEILTDEQAIEKAAHEQEHNFIPFLVIQKLCALDGFVPTEEDYHNAIAEIAKKQGMPLEEAMRKACFSLYQEMVFKEHLFTGMSPKAMACMEV